MTAPPEGLAVVDKAAGMTSHDVVDALRRRLRTRKVGHAGTLDPDATGVLLLGVGRVTRLLRFLGDLPKSYAGEVVLGTETSTLDAAGEVTATFAMDGVTVDDARAAVVPLTGDILQVPPMVSALKVGGRRLHALAREGIEVEREARPVTVHRFDVLGWADAGVLSVEVDCSSGTYVRSLAADLGRSLGGGAHLRALRRTAIGGFGVHLARPVEDAELLPPLRAVGHLARLDVSGDDERAVATGRSLARPSGPGPWAVTAGDELLAVYEARDDRAVPVLVLAAR